MVSSLFRSRPLSFCRPRESSTKRTNGCMTIMSRRRYEILLPIRYNDGAPVELDKLFQTQEELRNRAGLNPRANECSRLSAFAGQIRPTQIRWRHIEDRCGKSRKSG